MPWYLRTCAIVACMHGRLFVCLFVCLPVCLYVIRMYVCVRACVHVCTFAGVHVRMSACLHVFMCACVHVCTHIHSCMHACLLACLLVCLVFALFVCLYVALDLVLKRIHTHCIATKSATHLTCIFLAQPLLRKAQARHRITWRAFSVKHMKVKAEEILLSNRMMWDEI